MDTADTAATRTTVSAVRGAAPRFGAGFRTRHAREIADAPHACDWFEVLADGFIDVGGTRRALLARLRADHPVALHGLSLSIAGRSPLPGPYLRGLARLAAWLDPVAVSDHLCWTSLGGHESHDLLPVAYTEEVLDHVARRVARVQDVLGRRLLLENATAYVAFRAADMDEATFFAALCRRTGCGMLLDLNNLYVNVQNLGTDPARALAVIPQDAVGYLHLAGHAVLPDVRIDTHDADVPPPVWALFDAAVRRFPAAGVIVERDDDAVPFARIAAEVRWARTRHTAAPAATAPADDATHAVPAVRAPHRAAWPALQREFWARLVDQPVGGDHRARAGLGTLLADDRPVGAARGMRVYSDAYTVGLRRALATNFPALARVLSARDFDGLCAAYLRRHPPRGYDFRRLGARLAAFVRIHRFRDAYGVDARALADLAALEQAQLEVLDEIEAPGGVSPADLAALPAVGWERARFAFSPALRIVSATHDVLPVVEAVGRGAVPERPAATPLAYLVCRAEGALRTERLATREAAVLAALVAGRPFAVACALSLDVSADDAIVDDAIRALVTAARYGLVRRLDALALPGRTPRRHEARRQRAAAR